MQSWNGENLSQWKKSLNSKMIKDYKQTRCQPLNEQESYFNF